MNIQLRTDKIRYAKVNGGLVPLMQKEIDEDCGSGAIVWGFICAAAWALVAVILMCL